jgi:hypothetical protein
MYFVTAQMEISSFRIDDESVHQSISAKIYYSSQEYHADEKLLDIVIESS